MATQRAAKRKAYPGTFEDIGAYRRLILYVGGKRHTFKLETRDRKASEKFAREKHRELTRRLDRSRRGFGDSTPFSDLLAQYRRDELPTRSAGTQRAYADSLKPIEEFFVELSRDLAIDAISTKHIRAYLAWRRNQRKGGKNRKPTKEPVSNRTLQKDRAVLHRLFDFADQLELREGNPVSRVEQPKGDPRTPVLLSDDQYEALLKACAHRPQLYLYALTMGETGSRAISEVLHLRWEDVDLTEGFVEIRSGTDGHRTKSGKSRFVPMTPRLHAAMKDHFARVRFASYGGKKSPWVFHHEIARRACVPGTRITTMRSAFDSAAEAAGLPDAFHRHDLRHRRVTTWLAAGGNPVHVKEAMGHSDLRTTMGYTHLSKSHLRSLVGIPVGMPEPSEQTA